MIGLGKVLEGLECCMVPQEKGGPVCEDCPYADAEIGTCKGTEILKDAYVAASIADCFLKTSAPNVCPVNAAEVNRETD